jgi:pimeloyl-ACP methyl ester carboxylesterase
MPVLDNEEARLIQNIFGSNAPGHRKAPASSSVTRTPQKSLLLFVHGFCGGGSTFGVLPTFLERDPDISSFFEIDRYDYPTKMWNIPFFGRHQSIQELASGLTSEIKRRQNTNVVLCCHSMGGLIARRHVVELIKNQRPLKTKRMILVAVPNDGSGLANLARTTTFNSHLKQLCKESDFLSGLNEDWRTLNVKNQVHVNHIIGGNDTVVTKASALYGFDGYDFDTVPKADHVNIVKPDADRMEIVDFLKSILLSHIRG